MRAFYFILPLFIFLSCQQNAKTDKNQQDSQLTPDSIPQENIQIENQIDSTKAKEWLTATIIDFFESENPNMEHITTPEYYAFKSDAMNVDMSADDSLTEKDFIKKWGDKYNLKLHPIQTGFLISGQDWGKIRVENMKVLNQNQNSNSITFSLIIKDEEFKVDYDRDITVVYQDGKYLISDVLEYD